MKVMPGAVSQIAQNVADNLFEIGQSAVKATAGAVVDIAHESIEQIAATSGTVAQTNKPQTETANSQQKEVKKAAERRRLQEVQAELAQYVQRKQALDKKIAEEKAAESQQAKQTDFAEKRKKESYVQTMLKKLGKGSHGETDKQKE
jgi:hypothetical protein